MNALSKKLGVIIKKLTAIEALLQRLPETQADETTNEADVSMVKGKTQVQAEPITSSKLACCAFTTERLKQVEALFENRDKQETKTI